jgi:hypothetical protein
MCSKKYESNSPSGSKVRKELLNEVFFRCEEGDAYQEEYPDSGELVARKRQQHSCCLHCMSCV